MTILQDIQTALIEGEGDLAPILLKLKFLATRLGSVPLEEWVKHESEGYPKDAPIPDYRKTGISYTGDFSGPFQARIQNAPIPPLAIQNYAGEKWAVHSIRESIAEIEFLLSSRNDNSSLQMSGASNLIFKLSDNIYPGYNCVNVVGRLSLAALAGIQHIVRSRILDLTLELEKMPAAANIAIGANTEIQDSDKNTIATTVNNVTIQTIYGSGTAISNTGENIHIELLQQEFAKAGLSTDNAKELANLVQSEKSRGVKQVLESAKEWLFKKIGNAAANTMWDSVSEIISEYMKNVNG